MSDNTVSLKDAFSYLLKQYGIEDSFSEHKIKEAWAKTVGTYCNSFTTNVYYKNSILYVTISNAAVKNELSYAKTDIIAKINEIIGNELVIQIKIN